VRVVKRTQESRVFTQGFEKGRESALQEMEALAPHEVGCRCEHGGEFDWHVHDERCARRQIGGMLTALRADQRGLPKVPTPVESSPQPTAGYRAPSDPPIHPGYGSNHPGGPRAPEPRIHDSAIVVLQPGVYVMSPAPWVAWEIEVKLTHWPPPPGFDEPQQRLTIAGLGTARSVEEIAAALHEEYEEAAVENGYETRPESRVPWEQVPEANRATMLAAIKALLSRHIIDAGVKL
jgi:hypothetical protein